MSHASMTYGHSTRAAAGSAALLVNGLAYLVSGAITLLRKLDEWQRAPADSGPHTTAELLNWAARIEHTDPGFAADLRAVVARSDGER